MRLKKLMSLVLACAMALSLVTVASAADTRIYYVEDFSGHTDGPTYFNTSAYSDASGTSIVSKTAPEGATTFWGKKTSNSGSVPNYSKFITNGFGSNAFQLYTDELAASTHAGQKTGTYTTSYHLDSMWDFSVNTDETFVISYEYYSDQLAGIASALSTYGGTMRTYFADADKTTATSFSMLRERTDAGTAESGTEGEEGYVAAARPDNFIVDFPDGQGGSSKIGDALNIQNGSTIRTAVGFSYNTATNPNRYYAIDGVLKTTGTADRSKFSTTTKLFAFDKEWNGRMKEAIANMRAYTIKTNDFKVTAEKTSDVALSDKTMRIYFSNIVSPATFSKTVTVTKNDEVMTGYTVGDLTNVIGSVGGEIYSYVDVTFDALEEDTTYTISFADTIANEIGTTLGENNTVTFKTKAPDIKVTNYTLVSANESLKADGSVQGVKFELLNTTDADRNVALIYAVYAGTQLTDVIYVNEAIATGATATVEAATKLTAAGTLKAFVWDSLDTIRPYSYKNASGFAIAAE